MSRPDEPQDEELGHLPSVVDDDDEGPALAELLEHVSPELRGQFVQVLERQVSHRGWLPLPEQLAAYEQVLPGLAERIVRMPEREQEQRHRYLDEEGRREYRLRSRGQSFALLAMALLLAFSVFLALMGSLNLAAGVAVATIAATVGIFVTGKVVDKGSVEEDPEG